VTPYELRHTFASLLIHEGWKAPPLALAMGNSPDVVWKHYAHAFEQSEHATAEKMVDSIEAARRDVLKTYSPARKRQRQRAA